MHIEKIHLRKFILIGLLVWGLIYGIFSARYLFIEYLDKDSPLGRSLFNWPYFYLHPLLNRVIFYFHSVIGSLIFVLAPVIIYLTKKNRPSQVLFLRIYMVVALFPTIWPIWYLSLCNYLSISFFIILLIDILWLFILFMVYLSYRRHNRHKTIIYLIYHYCLSLGAALWRVLSYFVWYFLAVPFKEFVLAYSFDQNTPLHLTLPYDLTWFLALVISVLMAKLIIRTHTVTEVFHKDHTQHKG